MKEKAEIFEDITKLAGSAAGTLGSIKSQIKNEVKARVEEIALKMDLVPREDLDRVEALLKRTNENINDLTKRLEKLEGKN